jgi:alkanesulfonate monooxygenase SsuD/methylene tetrahydromethanopterin reductase-like flavin-dependent oxidoreductase (luciferase family)
MPTPSFHLFLPQMRMTVEEMVSRAQAAERGGFEGMALMDHLAPPGAEAHPMWEAMTAAGWLLSKTNTLKVGHLVLCDSMRHPAVLARQAVTLDHASGGRFELGLGWGSVPEELDVFGVGTSDARTRVERLSESLAVIKALWSGEPVDFEGTHFELHGATQRPVPLEGIAVVVGGAGRRTLELVSTYADWWNLPLYALERLETLRPSAGSAKVSIQQMVSFVGRDASRSEVRAATERRYGATSMGRTLALGVASELVEHFGSLRERGVERFYVWFSDFAPESTLEEFGENVIAPLSG